MKKLLMIILLLTFLSAAGCYKGDTGVDKDSFSEEELCIQEVGAWSQMPDACVDSCKSQRENLMCAQVLTFGCDCGPGKCWNGESCEII
jgi:hypothetical protein